MHNIIPCAWGATHFRFKYCLRFGGGLFLALVWLAAGTAHSQTTNVALGTSALLVGPTPGSNSVVLAVTPSAGTWTATANDAWLHLSPGNQSGTGSTNVVFSFDGNEGPTRLGTLTVGGLTLAITQAGTNYVACETFFVLPTPALNSPGGVALDADGNVYFTDSGIGSVGSLYEWIPTNNTTVELATGLAGPYGVAADHAGDVYVAVYNSGILKWTFAGGSNLTTFLSSGLSHPQGVMVDGAGNVYIADTYDNAVKEFVGANSNVTTLVSSGLNYPFGVAMDETGNIYIGDAGDGALKEWTAAKSNVITLASNLSALYGVAVDGSGNVYAARGMYYSTGTNEIVQWSPVTGSLMAFAAPGVSQPEGLAVDASGNIFIADAGNKIIEEWPHAFVDPTPKVETMAAGQDSISVLPINASLPGPLAPTSDQPWLAITGVSNGAVSFSFSATATNRLAHVSVLGQFIPVAQYSYSLNPDALIEPAATGTDTVELSVNPAVNPSWTATANAAWLHLSPANQSGTGNASVVFTFDANVGSTRTGTLTIAGQTLPVTQVGSVGVAAALGTTALVAGPAAGTNSVVLSVTPASGGWSATTDATWLHLTRANQNGLGSTNVIFSYDANEGPTRVGTLNIAGLTLAITQAGTNFVAANTAFVLPTPSLNSPGGVAVDAQGDVYFTDTGIGTVGTLFEWTPTNNTTIDLVTGFPGPYGLAVDNGGDVYIAVYSIGIQKWTAASGNVTTFLSSGLTHPQGVAVDGEGNVYIADTYDNAVKEWGVAGSNLTTLVSSGLSHPFGVAVDLLGNVYMGDAGDGALKEWMAASSNVATLAPSLGALYGLAVDGSGNVYAASGSNEIVQWSPATGSVTAFVPSGVSQPQGVAVDGAGNVYIADSNDRAIKEWPHAFVDPTPKLENMNAGQDSIPVLPTNVSLPGPLAPISNEPWITFTSVTHGAVNFSFSSNTGPARTASISLLGQTILVTQQTAAFYLATNYFAEGPLAGTNSVFLTSSSPTAAWIATANVSWLHLSSTNQSGAGSATVVFTFDANIGATRTGTLTIAGQTLTVTQGGPVGAAVTLGTTALLVGPASGTNSVALSVTPASGGWTATTVAHWLHLSPANQSGIGSTNVVFSYDANPGATRSGAFTLAGQTITVTQAGSTYASARPFTTLISSGLYQPIGIALDSNGNLYIANTQSNTIVKWTAVSGVLSTLVSAGLSNPYAVSVDRIGNVYIADSGNNAIKEWNVSSGTVTTLVSSGLSLPTGVAVDLAGNVYIADYNNNAIKEWNAATRTVTTLVSSGLSDPRDVAVDIAGNVYIANTSAGMTQEWIPGATNLIPLIQDNDLPDELPYGVGVDGSGNVYNAACSPYGPGGQGDEWIAALGASIELYGGNYDSGLRVPTGVVVDGNGNVYYADPGINVVEELPYAFVDPTAKVESLAAGSDSLPVVLPATENLGGPFNATSSQPWLTINGASGGVVSFSFTLNPGVPRTAQITLLGQSVPVTQNGPAFSLGAPSLAVGPAAGSNSMVLSVVPNFGVWTATTNAPWLHLSLSMQSGTGSTNVVFSYDANPGTTRTGTLTIAGQTLTVIQAGSNYVAAGPLTPLVSSGLAMPSGVAVDGAGNVYLADTASNSVQEWTLASNTMTTLVSNLNGPSGVAVDGAGNVYIADTTNNVIKKWTLATGKVTTLVSGLSHPTGVAVDAAGNVYFADTGNNAIKERLAANGNVIILVPGLNGPSGVAVDVAAKVYFSDSGNSAIKKWTAANSNLTTLISGLNGSPGVAVDLEGNVYIASIASNAIMKWTAASNILTTLGTGLNAPFGVAVDTSGNVYMADTGNNAIKEWPYAFVNPSPKLESASAGSDALVVLPSTQNLLAPFVPTTDQPWLTISSITNGVVSFSFAANLGFSRIAHIALLGQTVTITQGGASSSLGTSALLVGPSAGSNSVLLAVTPSSATWTATPNAAWLHLGAGYQSGAGSTNVFFSYDANSNATRSGTLTIAGQTLTITQAGSTYVAAGVLTALGSGGLIEPQGVAVDTAGNVYIADTYNHALKKWTLAANTVTVLTSAGLSGPVGVRLDGAGNLYVADYILNAVLEWNVANSNLSTLVSSGLDQPYAVALDAAGDVFIADFYHSAVKEWAVANGFVTTLSTPGLSEPDGVAVDLLGNLYMADLGHNAIKELAASSTNLITLASSGLSEPAGITVDGSGNVYVANWGDRQIAKWTAVSNKLSAPVATGLSEPADVAVDSAGNIYIADFGASSIKELPYAFVDPTPKSESAAAGADALPTVLPSTENLLPPFNPTSDQTWLTISGITNGVISFSFTSNLSALARTAHVNVLGQSIPITQGVIGAPPILTGAQWLGNGVVQFSFTNNPGATFTVLSTTNLSQPLNTWTVVGACTNITPTQFQFTSAPTTNDLQRFYCVRSP